MDKLAIVALGAAGLAIAGLSVKVMRQRHDLQELFIVYRKMVEMNKILINMTAFVTDPENVSDEEVRKLLVDMESFQIFHENGM